MEFLWFFSELLRFRGNWHMKNTTTRYLAVSLVLISFFCILVFGVQTMCMNLMGADAIRELGVIYM